jgi:conjugative transfer region lipoprotein (TIGR03751 family)
MLSACAGKRAVLPEEGRTMLEIYEDHVGDAGSAALFEARLALRRPVSEAEVDPAAYTRTAQNEIDALFVRLPNPDLVMYVFPHLATDEDVPIPGYSTVFPLYERVIYALPGEVP